MVFCLCSLLVTKILSTVVAGAQGLLRTLHLARPIARNSLLAGLLGLGMVIAAAVGGGSPAEDPASRRVALALLFVSGMLLTINAGGAEVERARRVGVGLAESGFRKGWPTHRLRHPDDMVWARLLLFVSLLSWPLVGALVFQPSSSVLIGLQYVIFLTVMSEALVNFEHADSHYHVFRTGRVMSGGDTVAMRALDVYVSSVLPLALTRVPYWYEVQHVVVHHAEDNGPNDTQSTLEFDRASFVDFASCAHRFALSSLLSVDVFSYLIRNGRAKPLRRLLCGLVLFYGFVGLLALFNWKCALLIVVWRYISGISSATGFFQEHGIVDTTRPENIYTNSLHFIAPDNDHGSRGEDFHIAHHLRPAQHWSEYQGEVASEMERYGSEGAIGFLDGPGRISDYFRLLWRRDFERLADYFVPLGGRVMSSSEMAELLRARTKPLSSVRTGTTKWDLLMGRVGGYLL